MTERAVSPMRGGGIHDLTWSVWPWVNWLLPILAIFAVGNNGWGLLMLLVVSPVLVPVLALLGSLPRFLLRRAGATTTPPPVTVLLFVQWWAWVAAVITPPGATDSRPIPAVMQGLSPRPLSGDFLGAVMAGGALLGVLCGVAVLVLAIILRTKTLSVPAVRRWTRASLIAAFALPVLFVALIWTGGEVTAQQRDAAGDTVAEVQAQPLSQQAARALERHEQTQTRLSEARGMIAADGWRVSARGIDQRLSSKHGVDAYGFDLEFEHDRVSDEVVQAARADLLAAGWSEGERGRLVDAQGYSIEIVAYAEVVVVSVSSPTWWGEDYDLSEELGLYDRSPSDEAFVRTYASDEWPSL